MLNNGTDKCSCPNTDCERNAKCKECLQYHKERNSKTRCQRDAEQKEPAKDKT
jgi:hypothetical protein